MMLTWYNVQWNFSLKITSSGCSNSTVHTASSTVAKYSWIWQYSLSHLHNTHGNDVPHNVIIVNTLYILCLTAVNTGPATRADLTARRRKKRRTAMLFPTNFCCWRLQRHTYAVSGRLGCPSKRRVYRCSRLDGRLDGPSSRPVYGPSRWLVCRGLYCCICICAAYLAY